MTDEECTCPEIDPREKFQEAIKELLDSFGYDGFLTDWHLITVQSHVHDDGSTGSSYSVFVNEHAPVHSIAGLLQYATLKNAQHIQKPWNSEEE